MHLVELLRLGDILTPERLGANPELLAELRTTLDLLDKHKAGTQASFLVMRLAGYSFDQIGTIIGDDKHDTENRFENLCRTIRIITDKPTAAIDRNCRTR